MRTELTVAVTTLARFCHRRGDIDHRFSPSPTGTEGIAGHQRLYARRPDTYEREHAVEYRHDTAALRLHLRGRADGYDASRALVEEIKTCRVPPRGIPAAVAELHRAQGRLYAAMIAARDAVAALTVRVTWLNVDSGEEYSSDETLGAAELAAFLAASLERFADWLERATARRARRDASLRDLAFPHGEFRAGQREIAELCYKCIDQGGQLLLEAPTGLGKTAAVLYPALKALATGKHERIVYATAKTIGRRAAEATLALLRTAGYRGSALSLSAKESICLAPGRACHGDDCPYARGYYDKLPAALDAALDAATLDRAEIERLAQDHAVCPYELAWDLLPWVDVVIADLHYLYSLHPGVAGALEGTGERYTVLLDEAHNLPGRARGMYGASLAKSALLGAKRAASGPVAKALERVNRRLLDLQHLPWQEPDWHSGAEAPTDLLRALEGFCAAVADELARDPAALQRTPPLLEFYFDALHFLRAAQQWGPEFRLQLSRGAGRQSLVATLNCLDPSRLLRERQARAHAVVAFSATLSPLPWSRACLGLAEHAVCSRAVSPFAQDQLTVWLATAPDTRYHRRQQTLPGLAGLLGDWLERTPGNCLIYFPSYRYLEDCRALLEPVPERRLWTQAREMGEGARLALLELLATRRDVAALCILGGVFGEGIDLPGEQLASVVVVGVGMPQVNRETRELQHWHQRSAGAGFDFAFLFPGMQKVDQALGRVVRRAEDRGSALLIDPRYGARRYRALLPPWWRYRRWPPEEAAS